MSAARLIRERVGCRVAAEPLISVIDDDDSLRQALVRLIHSLGYDARGFASAEEFIASGTMAGCSCVITDIQMPGMSGIELVAHLQTPVPVIMITARAEADLEQSAMASGAMCFLRKPIDTKVLVEWVERALNP
jgi:FixJ family two-component response regulator